MPHDERGRPAGNGAAQVTAGEVVPTSVANRPDVPHARAYAGPPCRGRSLWLVMVLSCPHCGTAHVHRVGEAARLLAARVVRECPVTGRAYQLAPVQRRREARRG